MRRRPTFAVRLGGGGSPNLPESICPLRCPGRDALSASLGGVRLAQDQGRHDQQCLGAAAGLVLQNFVDAWRIAEMGSRILNSLLITVSALVILVAVATPCAYAAARFIFAVAAILAIVVAAMLVPPQVMAIPLFIVARDLGLINNRLGIAVIYASTSLPLSVFILRSFFLTLPPELEDAAPRRRREPVDDPDPHHAAACSAGRRACPDLWLHRNLERFLPRVPASARQPQLQTIPLGLVNFFQQYDSLWNLYFAALTITTLPVIVVFIAMQRQFIAGLTAGAVKG